jgi:hypothetical protein
VAGQSVTLAWEPSPDTNVVTHILRYGTRSGNYSTEINAGNASPNTVTNLVDGVTYYFVVVASNSLGLVSEPSNEVRWTAPGLNNPPSISGI